MPNKTELLLSLLGGQPVIPVLKIDRAVDAVPLARALARGGLRVIEITLRTAEALEAIRRAANEVEDAVVGAGTILNPRQFEEAFPDDPAIDLQTIVDAIASYERSLVSADAPYDRWIAGMAKLQRALAQKKI